MSFSRSPDPWPGCRLSHRSHSREAVLKPVPPWRSFEECLEAAWHFLFKLQSLAPFSRRQKQTRKSKCAPGPTIYLWENWALTQVTSYLTLTSSPLGPGWKNTACMLLILSMQPKSLKWVWVISLLHRTLLTSTTRLQWVVWTSWICIYWLGMSAFLLLGSKLVFWNLGPFIIFLLCYFELKCNTYCRIYKNRV